LKKAGLNFEEDNSPAATEEQFMDGTKWVITGSFENFKPREKAGELIKKYGGELLSSVTGKTTHLLAGSDAGSKLDKAKTFGTKIVGEKEFLQIIESKILK
jgi:DNA ligase (NAD+)